MGWVQQVDDSINDVDIGLGNIVGGTETNKQVDPPHGAPIGFSIMLVDGGNIL